jgi:ribose 5-phosphate isomerase B
MLTRKKIAIASDHAGFFLKEKIREYLRNENVEIKDFGTFSGDAVDYTDFAHPLASAVAEGDYELGISICATGNGVNMTVNKHQGIRGALCWNEEMSRLARAHNNSNICAIPGRFVSESEAILIVKTFLSTSFDEGRHRKRIDKIPIKKY